MSLLIYVIKKKENVPFFLDLKLPQNDSKHTVVANRFCLQMLVCSLIGRKFVDLKL